MLRKADMEAAVNEYLKDMKRGGLGGPFVVARFAAEILHSRDRLLTHQNFFVRFIPEVAHKWLAGYIMRGCYTTWGEAECAECYNRQRYTTPMTLMADEHKTMVRLMEWYWIKEAARL